MGTLAWDVRTPLGTLAWDVRTPLGTLAWDVRAPLGTLAWDVRTPLGTLAWDVRTPLGTLAWDVRPRWGRALHRHGRKVSNGNQDVIRGCTSASSVTSFHSGRASRASSRTPHATAS